MKKTIPLAGLALAAVALAGCGGGTPGSAAPPASPASSAASPDAAPTTSAAASPSTGTAAKVVDPCTRLDAGQVQDLTGVKVKKGTTQSVGTSNVCTWLPTDGTTKDAAVISAQEGALQGSLSQVEDQLKSEFGGTVSKLSVAGADDARYVTGKKSGLNVVDVLAQKDEVFYQVLVATPRNAAQHKSGAVKVAEALLKG